MFFPKQLRGNSAIARPQAGLIAPVYPSARRALEAGCLRIVTYNIHKGVSALARRSRIHELRSGIHDMDADIVFLQEVQGRNDRHAKRFANWPADSQHDFLAAEGWSEAVYGRNVVSDGRHYSSDHGNALLSRFNLIESENIDISDHRFEGRGLLHCVLEIAGRRVHCICAHLGLFADSRMRQVEALVARIRATVPDDEALIIAGDFNDWRNQLARRLTDKLGVIEAFEDHQHGPLFPWGRVGPQRILPARTFPSLFPFLRLDRVYLRGFKVRHAMVVRGGHWRKLSDHSPILVDLQVS